MSAAKVKARNIYGRTHGNVFYKTRLDRAELPSYVLPADAESVADMVEQMAVGMFLYDFDRCEAEEFKSLEKWRAEEFRKQARAALAAIGINGGAK